MILVTTCGTVSWFEPLHSAKKGENSLLLLLHVDAGLLQICHPLPKDPGVFFLGPCAIFIFSIEFRQRQRSSGGRACKSNVMPYLNS